VRIVIDRRGDFEEWRDHARRLLCAGIQPDAVEWLDRAALGDDLFGVDEAIPETKAALTVPRAFVECAQVMVCHADLAAYGVLYRLLWRLQTEGHLLSITTDPDVARAHQMAKSVGRDSHKMKAFVRFKELPHTEGRNRRQFLAWFEPDHYIVGRTAGFFQRRFTDMDWVIATPKGSSSWDGDALTVSAQPATNPELADDTDDLWRTYFANIFNPARLKVKMMQTEMPKKYWKNLPEADLIPDLIAGAEDRVRAMAAKPATTAPKFHYRIHKIKG
jgi:probable DNA metabolism protein